VSANEKEIVARAQQGDTAAFETLVDLHAKYVYNLALRVVQNPQEAEDLAQEAFLRAWRGLPSFRGQSKFSTWLYRIVTNLCYTQIPRIKRDLISLIPDEEAVRLPDVRLVPEERVLDTELRIYLQHIIEELPESYRLLITLRHLQNLSYKEISQVTGMPLGTVKTGIFRARQMLKIALENFEVEYG
jgi:RNA polymerase sigma-70 factor (ECF subfamily)